MLAIILSRSKPVITVSSVPCGVQKATISKNSFRLQVDKTLAFSSISFEYFPIPALRWWRRLQKCAFKWNEKARIPAFIFLIFKPLKPCLVNRQLILEPLQALSKQKPFLFFLSLNSVPFIIWHAGRTISPQILVQKELLTEIAYLSSITAVLHSKDHPFSCAAKLPMVNMHWLFADFLSSGLSIICVLSFEFFNQLALGDRAAGSVIEIRKQRCRFPSNSQTGNWPVSKIIWDKHKLYCSWHHLPGVCSGSSNVDA